MLVQKSKHQIKIISLFIILYGLMITTNTTAQKTKSEGGSSTNKKEKKVPEKDNKSSKISVLAGAGTANYFGDLLQYNRFFSQPGFAVSAGASYSVTNQLSVRIDVAFLQVKAADRNNKGTQYKERNLSFKSNIFDVSAAAEFNVLNMNKYPFSPYISAGVGVMFFNPYANDLSGKKQYLRELGTEGQGLAGYPGIYRKTAAIFPAGFGFKYAAGKKVIIQLEFNYRFTTTDYLDDVSTSGYPAKALLDARNPATAKFTWRGGEVGGEAYPKNLNLPRGNPNNKDGYYTTQFKVAFKL